MLFVKNILSCRFNYQSYSFVLPLYLQINVNEAFFRSVVHNTVYCFRSNLFYSILSTDIGADLLTGEIMYKLTSD